MDCRGESLNVPVFWSSLNFCSDAASCVGLLILAELCAGVAGGKTVLIILCAVVYIAATFALQMLDKGETQNGQ